MKLGLLIGLPSAATYVVAAYPAIDGVLLLFGLSVAAGAGALLPWICRLNDAER